MAPRLTPNMRKVLDVLKRERPLTAHALGGFLPQLNVRRIELLLGRLRGENLVRIACFDGQGYPAYSPGSPVVTKAPRKRRLKR